MTGCGSGHQRKRDEERRTEAREGVDAEWEEERPSSAGEGRGRRRYGRTARKERILHTRISEDLAEDIRRLADDLRVPVSNVVRTVLEEAFSVVETVTDNMGDIIEEVVGEAEGARERMRHRRRRHRYGHRRHRYARRHARRDAPERAASERASEREETERAPRQEFPDVVGWQPLVMNQPRSCADCEESQEPGERAFVGLTEQGLSATTLCADCMDARR